MNSRNHILAAVVLSALHDLAMSAVMGGEGQPEPGPEPDTTDRPERAFAPGSRASADMSGEYSKGAAALHPDAAVSQDWIDGAEHARRQFAGHEEARFAEERQRDRDRMELEFHANLRHNSVVLAFANGFQGTNTSIIERASAIYDFICFGKDAAQAVN
jgi:hypothetical protein